MGRKVLKMHFARKKATGKIKEEAFGCGEGGHVGAREDEVFD